MNINDILGRFSILGSNQDNEGNSYSRTLTLTVDHNNRINAKWTIGFDQTQHGTGFLEIIS
ncbi:hypothetical protein [Flavobacterium sp.]|uniref:hypothetical protein n=1 Tax=Flavobacterium sp. TaxID=239 RepID=UPI002635834E|nr:hypothetical protein [Flavobacterium sp.]MDG2432929.1 hypothetical protein [Flavobacterium sp.]